MDSKQCACPACPCCIAKIGCINSTDLITVKCASGALAQETQKTAFEVRKRQKIQEQLAKVELENAKLSLLLEICRQKEALQLRRETKDVATSTHEEAMSTVDVASGSVNLTSESQPDVDVASGSVNLTSESQPEVLSTLQEATSKVDVAYNSDDDLYT